ncbi:hypothetical protein BB029_28420 [Pseudomonas sp. S3E12]|nr:hypothetical protein BB029_28420 [Pseudomonas sp. S3E12]
MYDVSAMESELQNSMAVVKRKIRTTLAAAFKNVYCSDLVPDQFSDQSPPIDLVSLVSIADLNVVV